MAHSESLEAQGTGAGTNKADAIKTEVPSNDKNIANTTRATQNGTRKLGKGGLEEQTHKRTSVSLKSNQAPALLKNDSTDIYRSTGHGLDLKVEDSWGLVYPYRGEGASGNDLVT
ncbi:MAG: hypothetical protein Q9224_006005, partial [Gallowayella concinna]